jgi:hypothetical protein
VIKYGIEYLAWVVSEKIRKREKKGISLRIFGLGVFEKRNTGICFPKKTIFQKNGVI